MIFDKHTKKYISQNVAYGYLLECREKFLNTCESLEIGLDSKLLCGDGGHSGVNPGFFYIGVNGISHNSAMPVNDLKFVKALVSINHEFRHYQQYNVMRLQDDDVSIVITLSKRAGRSNPVYYDMNYCRNSSEYDAELYGLKEAYKWCITHFGEKTASRLICLYATDKAKESAENHRLYVYSELPTI